MPNLTRIAFRLSALLLLYVVNPTVAWVVLAGGVIYLVAQRRRRTLRSVSVS